MTVTTLNKSLQHQKGSSIGLFLFSVTLIMVFFLVSISAIRFTTLQTRLHHAADNALALIAREGLAVDDEEAQYLARTFVIYNLPIGIRSDALKNRNDLSITIGELGYEKNLYLSIEQAPKPITKMMPTFSARVEKRLIREIQTMETVLSLDLSRSMSDKIGGGLKPSVLMPGILDDFIESLTGEQIISEDHHIGLVPFSGYINVGQEYQNQLVTPLSRQIQPELRHVASEHGYGQDFLHNFGVEGRRDGACIKRNITDTSMIGDILDVPMNPSQGFDLLVYHNYEPLSEANLRREIIQANSGRVPEHLLPFEQTHSDGHYIGTAGACPSMALHEVSGRTESLREMAKKYYATHTTGGDQGLIWAWRMLDSGWKNAVWKDPGHTLDDPKQRIILFTDGKNNVGLQDDDYTRLLENVCLTLATDEIKVDVILFDQGISQEEIAQYKACSAITGGRYHYVLGDDLGALQLFFARMGIRQYKIRFI
ncbi:hypothetical protein AB4259_15360 [Vibrio amylolyticus]|uniref:hypothetical protein n=1 Tax=Vibrio amylolyticus TaxID=2847292 RepID=UPI0035515E44